jgi:hypothetical protein
MEHFRSVLIVFSFLFLLSCDSGTAQGNDKLLDAQGFNQLVAEDDQVQLVDIRTPRAVSMGMIEGAEVINFIQADFKDQIDKLE